jgi:hypothetical protein
MTWLSLIPTPGLATRKPDAANPPKTIVQNAAAPTASKVNDAIIVHLIAKYSLGNRMPSEAELTGSGGVIGWILLVASSLRAQRSNPLLPCCPMDCLTVAGTADRPITETKNPPETSPADR